MMNFALVFIKTVVYIDDLAARIAEYGIDALLDQGADQDICAGKGHGGFLLTIGFSEVRGKIR